MPSRHGGTLPCSTTPETSTRYARPPPPSGIWLNRTGQSSASLGTGSAAGSRHQVGSKDPPPLATQPAGSTSRAPPSSTDELAAGMAASGLAGELTASRLGGDVRMALGAAVIALVTVGVGSSRAPL